MGERLALHGGPRAITMEDPLRRASIWPAFTGEEKKAVNAVLDSGDVYGPIARFEEEFASYMGVRHALATNNGTSSIQSAYFAAGVGPGDEVITSSYTWHLQVGQILALHAIPIFCDIDPRSACIDPDEINRQITPRTKAIAVLHPYGAVAPMDEILGIAKDHGIPVIEDCSHAHGSTYRGKKAGTLGDIGCFSLQASKLMTGIEAGVMVTDNEEYYERACLLGHYERIPKLSSKEYRRFYLPEKEMAPACFGFKYRIHPLAAAIARVQLRHLDDWTKIRRRNMCYVTDRLKDVGQESGGAFEPPYEGPESKRVWLNYICLYHADRAGVPRARFIEALNAEGLPVTGGRTGYLPVYWNPVYEELSDIWGKGYPFKATYVKRKITYPRGLCPHAENHFKRTVGLPVLHRAVDQQLLEEYVGAISKVLNNLDDL